MNRQVEERSKEREREQKREREKGRDESECVRQRENREINTGKNMKLPKMTDLVFLKGSLQFRSINRRSADGPLSLITKTIVCLSVCVCPLCVYGCV